MRNNVLCYSIFPLFLKGEEILRELVDLSGKISVRIAVNFHNKQQPSDIQQLITAGQCLTTKSNYSLY